MPTCGGLFCALIVCLMFSGLLVALYRRATTGRWPMDPPGDDDEYYGGM